MQIMYKLDLVTCLGLLFVYVTWADQSVFIEILRQGSLLSHPVCIAGNFNNTQAMVDAHNEQHGRLLSLYPLWL